MEHEFALYLNNLSSLLEQQPGESITIDNKDLFHRMTRVLRLRPGQKIILFDAMQHIQLILEDLEGKSRIIGHIHMRTINKRLVPDITFVLPILKREDLSDAVYGLTEAGVNSIQLVTTQKVQRAWAGDKEFERLQRVVIAAAEQAKQFALPFLHKPLPLYEYVMGLHPEALKLYADPEGSALFDTIQYLHAQHSPKLFIMIGPEGDLTPSEKELLRSVPFDFFALTPTILRAKEAALISAAVFRAIL